MTCACRDAPTGAPRSTPSIGIRTRTDESEIGQVRSLQNSLGQRFVERMAVRHHEKIGADGGAVDFGLGGIGADDLYVRWNIVGKFLFSRIHPSDPAANVS